jgi:hypothetical protein
MTKHDRGKQALGDGKKRASFLTIKQTDVFDPEPIFGPDTDLRLSELDVPPGHEAAYAFGREFVKLHKDGCIGHDYIRATSD